jgi:hypothetical protein
VLRVGFGINYIKSWRIALRKPPAFCLFMPKVLRLLAVVYFCAPVLADVVSCEANPLFF